MITIGSRNKSKLPVIAKCPLFLYTLVYRKSSAKAFESVGKDGVITIEEGNNVLSSLTILEGTRINRGYISPYMCADQSTLVAELTNPYILVTDKKISQVQEILPIIEKVAKAGGSLFIIAEDVEGEALTTIVINNMRKIFNCLCVKTPYFGDRRKKVLDDIALTVGAKFISGDIYNNRKKCLEEKCSDTFTGQAKQGCLFLANFMEAAGNPEHDYYEIDCPEVLANEY